MELNAGTYWFSTDGPKDSPVKVEVLPSHSYFLGKNRHGLVAQELHSKKGSEHPVVGAFLEKDLTKLTPEEYRSLTAEPSAKAND